MKTTKLKELILFILSDTGPVSRLKLAKLLYLIEWQFYRKCGTQLTKAYYMRERRGPVPATFGKEIEEMMGFEVERTSRGLIGPGRRPRFMPSFTEETATFLRSVVRRYREKSDRDLLLATYVTEPMKTVLKEERAGAIRKHEGIIFGRFRTEAQSRPEVAPGKEAGAERITYVSAENMTDEDTIQVLSTLQQNLPLIVVSKRICRGEPETLT
jgi:hypothetical protein